MKTHSCLVMLASLALSVTVEAQKPGRFGIGVAMGTDLIASVRSENLPPTVSITFPMNLGPLRLEPEFGHTSASFKVTDQFFGIDEEMSTTVLGVGAFFATSPREDFVLYVGPRVGILLGSTTERDVDPDQKSSSTDSYFGVAVGGEHFFSSHLSLGAEARFTHFASGKTKYEPDNPNAPEFDISVNLTATVVMVRFYF